MTRVLLGWRPLPTAEQLRLIPAYLLDVARGPTPRRRNAIAWLIALLPGQCWADLYGWAIRDDLPPRGTGTRLPTRPAGPDCLKPTGCWCGKYRPRPALRTPPIDQDIVDQVDAMRPDSLAQRVAIENTLQARRDRAGS